VGRPQKTYRAISFGVIREPVAVSIDRLFVGNNFCGDADEPALTIDRRAAAVAVNYASIGLDPVRQYVSAFDDAPIGMALIDLDGRWLRLNRSLCQMLGRSEQQLRTTELNELSHPDDRRLDRPLIKELLAGRRRSFAIENTAVAFMSLPGSVASLVRVSTSLTSMPCAGRTANMTRIPAASMP